jgi:O-antigen/teichoic acid export membrane protein
MATATGGVMAVGLFLFAPWLAEVVLGAPHLAPLLRVAAPLLILSAMNGAQTGALSGFEAFRTIAIINTLVSIIQCPLVIGAAYVGGLEGAVWGFIAATTITWLTGYFAVRAEARRGGIRIQLDGIWREWKVLFNYSLPWLLSSIMVAPIHWLCNALLVNQPNGYAELGLFNAAEKWFPVVAFLPLVFARPLFPILSQQIANNDRAKLFRTLLYFIAVNAAVVFPIVLMGCVFSRWIMGWYGVSFVDGAPTLSLLLLTAGLAAVQTPLGQAITVMGRMWSAFAVSLIWGGVLVIATCFWLDWGAFGLGSARLVAAIVYNILGFALVYVTLRCSDERPDVAEFTRDSSASKASVVSLQGAAK